MIPDPDAAIPDPKNMQKPRNICIHICNTLVQQWHFISLIYELMPSCFEFSSKSGVNLSNSFIPEFPLIRNRSENCHLYRRRLRQHWIGVLLPLSPGGPDESLLRE